MELVGSGRRSSKPDIEPPHGDRVQVFERVHDGEPTPPQDRDPVGHPLHLRQRVRGQKHRPALRHHIADRVQGAQFVGLDSNVHLICVSDVIDELTDAIESFICRVVHS